MGTRRALVLFPAVLLLLRPAAARPAELAIDLKNDASMTVSVPVGADNGVTPASDFQAEAGGSPVAIYPNEIHERRFWSQPLSEEAYVRLRTGTPVRRAALDNAAHIQVRVEGEARKAAYREKWEAARREAGRREIDDLRRKKAGVEDRREALDFRIAEAEKAFAEEEGRLDWLTGSEEQDIDRALQNIEDDADRRDELQDQRNALAGKSPYPQGEIERLGAEIRRLNDRIASERARIRSSRERKRTARTNFLSRRKEWQNLVSDRKALDVEARAIDRRIRELSESVR